MLIKTPVVVELKDNIKHITKSRCWISGILKSLPGKDISEFSEYETYANFFVSQNPSKFKLTDIKWFRYGAEIFNDMTTVTYEEVSQKFRGYQHVAFERHPPNFKRKILAHILLGLKR